MRSPDDRPATKCVNFSPESARTSCCDSTYRIPRKSDYQRDRRHCRRSFRTMNIHRAPERTHCKQDLALHYARRLCRHLSHTDCISVCQTRSQSGALRLVKWVEKRRLQRDSGLHRTPHGATPAPSHNAQGFDPSPRIPPKRPFPRHNAHALFPDPAHVRQLCFKWSLRGPT